MKKLKIDKDFLKAQSFEEAEKGDLFDKTVAFADRLRMSFHLSCVIHGIKEGDPLKLDRAIFSAHKFNDA